MSVLYHLASCQRVAGWPFVVTKSRARKLCAGSPKALAKQLALLRMRPILESTD